MDRIVYILQPEGRRLTCITRTTKLMKWERFGESTFPNLKTLFGPKYASYRQPEDRAIIMDLLQLVQRPGQEPVLDGDYGFTVFQRMRETGRLFFATGSHLRLQETPPQTSTLYWESLTNQTWCPRVTLPPGWQAFALCPPIYVNPEANACGRLQFAQPDQLAQAWLAAGPLNEADARRFCLRLARKFPEIDFPTPEGIALNRVAPTPPKALLTIEQRTLVHRRDETAVWIDLPDRLRLRLEFRYGGAKVAWDAPEPSVAYRQNEAIFQAARDPDWEARILAQLTTWGFSSDQFLADAGFFSFDSSLFVLGPGQTWRRLLAERFPALPSDQWEINFGRGLRVRVVHETDTYSATQDLGRDTFSFDAGIDIAGQRTSLLSTLHAALRAQKKRRPGELAIWLHDGDFALRRETAEGDPVRVDLFALPLTLLASITEQFHEIFDAKPFDATGEARISQWRVGELIAGGLLAGSALPEDQLTDVVRLCERLRDGIVVAARPAPPRLRATLRPYQELGLGWLHALSEVAAGGILADDMGLGKTVQMIAHLLELKASQKLTQGVLLVAPTSVLANWVAELARFAPELRVGTYYGADRDKIWSQRSEVDLVVTSYSLLWRDGERLTQPLWDLVILDEAQFIKNARSRTSEAARALQAHRRICLTGTPIENRLEDIWALFEFVLPGFLGDEDTFRQRIAKPLTEDAAEGEFSATLRDRLRARLRPFVLRRSKAEVLPDLPAKTELVHAVSMLPAQAELYAARRQEARDSIRTKLADQGLAKAKLHILVRLLQLRQICCDPRLLASTDEGENSEADSAKLLALLDLLDDLLAQGSRVLIFSQFTSMLDLIAHALTTRGHDYLLLTGSTQDRGGLVRRFQEGVCPIFLISLRAGGSGLNLTAADCVIHYDPWWNPAVERQASDRSHRLGQLKPVFVYKLIVDESIESKIQELQRTKLALVEGLLSEGDIEHVQLDESTIEYLLSD